MTFLIKIVVSKTFKRWIVCKDMVKVDPWSSELIPNYTRLIKQFGLQPFSVKGFTNPNRLMRRGAVFGGRDLSRIATCIAKKKPFYALTGIMPTADKIHFGNKMAVENLVYFQKHGAQTYILIADLEAAAARGVSLSEAQRRAKKFHIPAYLALGLDARKTKFYFQSQNKNVSNLGFRFSKKVTFNEFKAIYGHTEPGKIMSAVLQCGDMLYPQLAKRMPGVIPVGCDQDCHVRLCRDLVSRFKSEKFVPISSIYHQFTPALNGKIKMSKSHPESCFDLPEDAKSVAKKITRAKSGGRATLAEHRKKGADVAADMTFAMLKLHFVESDAELTKIYDAYSSGSMTTGELKSLAIEKITAYMADFEKKMRKARKQVDKLKFVG